MWINNLINTVAVSISNLFTTEEPVVDTRKIKPRKKIKRRDSSTFTPKQIEYILDLRRNNYSYKDISFMANKRFNRSKHFTAYYKLIKKHGVQ